MSVVTLTKKPYLPVFQLEKNDASNYTFNPFIGTYDFRVRKAKIRPPMDNKQGKFSITLTSQDASTSASNTILSNIEEGNEIVVWIGKDNTNKVKIFRGIVEDIIIDEPNRNYMDVMISGPDWGSDLLKSRVVNGAWIQKKTADGITLDSSDDDVLVSQIVEDLLTKTSSYPVNDVAAEDQGLVVSSSNIVLPDVRLASFVSNYERLDDKISEIDAILGTLHWVDPDKNFHMEVPVGSTTSLPTDTLFTDDYTNATALTWDQTKLGLLGKGTSIKNTVENRKKRIFGLGGDEEVLDQKQETNGGSTSLEGIYLGQKFTPTFRYIEGVTVFLSKTGSPVLGPTIEIIEDAGGEPEGTIIRSVKTEKEKVTASGEWIAFKIQAELNTAKDYWILSVPSSSDDASNHYNWFHDNGTSHTHATSSDAVSWTVNTNNKGYMFRHYSSSPLVSVKSDYSNLLTSKHYHEEVIRKPDITLSTVLWKLLDGESRTLFKRKQILTGQVYAPDTLITTGQRIHVVKESSGKVINTLTDGVGPFVLGEQEYNFQSSKDLATGTFWLDVDLVRFVD